MVINCVAYGCNNLQDKRKPISFHGFPFKRPQILERWITAVRRENWAPTKSSRLCGEHFLQTDYQVKPGSATNFLKPDAVPSIFSYSTHLVSTARLPLRKLLKHVEPTLNMKVEPMNNDLPSTSTETQMFVDEENNDVLPLTSAESQMFLGEENNDVLPSTSTESIIFVDVDSTEYLDSNDLLSTSTESKIFVDKETQTKPDDRVTVLRRKVKTLRQKLRRRDSKLSSMKGLVNEVRKNVMKTWMPS